MKRILGTSVLGLEEEDTNSGEFEFYWQKFIIDNGLSSDGFISFEDFKRLMVPEVVSQPTITKT